MIIFWSFFPNGNFFQKITHNYIWAPNTMLSFRKKLISQSRENLRTDGRTEEREDRWTDRPYFIVIKSHCFFTLDAVIIG